MRLGHRALVNSEKVVDRERAFFFFTPLNHDNPQKVVDSERVFFFCTPLNHAYGRMHSMMLTTLAVLLLDLEYGG